MLKVHVLECCCTRGVKKLTERGPMQSVVQWLLKDMQNIMQSDEQKNRVSPPLLSRFFF